MITYTQNTFCVSGSTQEWRLKGLEGIAQSNDSHCPALHFSNRQIVSGVGYGFAELVRPRLALPLAGLLDKRAGLTFERVRQTENHQNPGRDDLGPQQ